MYLVDDKDIINNIRIIEPYLIFSPDIINKFINIMKSFR